MRTENSKIINKIGKLLLLITIVIFNTIIGANDKGLRVLPISILMGLIIIYLIILKIKNTQKVKKKLGKCKNINNSIFLKSKIDYLVLAFMLITTLPFIFRTYASYSDTIEFIMKYFFIYCVYILARNVIKDIKSMELTITVTIISSLIPAILGLDILYGHCLNDFIKWLNLNYNAKDGLHATFGYANTMAIYMAFCIFLAMHKVKIHNKKIFKILNVIYIVFAVVIIYLTKALAVELLLGIAVFTVLIAKYRKQIVKHKKKIVIGFGSFICIVTTILIITINKTSSVIVNGEDIQEFIIYNFKKDQTYTLELNMKTEETDNSKHNRTKVFEIELLEYGKYFKELTILKQYSSAIDGNFKVDFTPTQDTRYIRIKIRNLFRGKITIDNWFINGERQIVKFKYYPFYVGQFFVNFNITGKSIPERLNMYNDCLKIAKNNFLLGNGGNAWEVLSRSVAEYECAFKECHSYFFELLISYGIVGVIAFWALIIYFFINIFKQCKKDENKRKEKLLISIGLVLLLIHSMIDFNMSFMLIQLIVYIFIAILQYGIQNETNNKNVIDSREHNNNSKSFRGCFKSLICKYKILDYFVIIFLVFIFSLYVREDISEYIVQDTTTKYEVAKFNKNYYLEKIKQEYNQLNKKDENTKRNNEDYKKILQEIQEFIKKEPYNFEQTENYERYFNILYLNMDSMTKKELELNLGFLVDKIESIPYRVLFAFNYAIYRTTILNKFIEKLETYKNIEQDTEKIEIVSNSIDRLKKVIIKENEINLRNMEDYNKHNYKEYEIEHLKKQIPNY